MRDHLAGRDGERDAVDDGAAAAAHAHVARLEHRALVAYAAVVMALAVRQYSKTSA